MVGAMCPRHWCQISRFLYCWDFILWIWDVGFTGGMMTWLVVYQSPSLGFCCMLMEAIGGPWLLSNEIVPVPFLCRE